MLNSTITAISTPAGVGGIAVIRVSGENAFEICEKIFVATNEKKLTETPANTVVFGQIYQENSVVDQVLVTIFRAPHSFTGEDTVEISCHGSLYIQQKILELLLAAGARLATAGEFTQRAFLNGKMDLSQAEAVADLIASTSAAAHSMAMNQMRGGFSAELKQLRTQLLDFASLIELELDFSEEDVEFADRQKLHTLAQHIEQHIAQLADSFRVGNALKNGIPVALVGETNVGKSTLLNLLLNEEKAIVSDIHGTTRDVIEDTVNIRGITFRFIDTAGIRQTRDTVENLGIERTFQQIEKAAIVLWLVDGTGVSEHIEWLTEKILRRAEGKKVILIFNKIDKISAEELDILHELFEPFDCRKIKISAKHKLNTETLQQALIDAVSPAVANRHCGLDPQSLEKPEKAEIKFEANKITCEINKEEKYYMIGFSDNGDEPNEYVVLQRAFTFDEQDIKLGMNTCYFEYSENSGYGICEKMEIENNKIVFHLKDKIIEITFDNSALMVDRNEFKNVFDKIFEGISTENNTKILQQSPPMGDSGGCSVIVSNVRHYEALNNALSAIRKVNTGLQNNLSGDFLSQDIRECLHFLGEITGEISTAEILQNIFSKFCIGK